VYSTKIKSAIARSPRNLGGEMARRAVSLDFSVVRISQAIGATRQSVYNWMLGVRAVSPAYVPRVKVLLRILTETTNADDAWSKACQEFKLRT
jgi:hypothetical protein